MIDKAYNAYKQSLNIDNIDKLIISRIIKISKYQIISILNNDNFKKGYFTTKYFNEQTKEYLNKMFKDIKDAKQRIYRLCINGIIEKEYHNKNFNSFRLKIYSKLFKKA